MSNRRPSSPFTSLPRHLACALGVFALLALGAAASAGDAQANPDTPMDEGAEPGKSSADLERAGDIATPGKRVDAAEDRGEPSGDDEESEGEDLLDAGACPMLFGDDETQDYNRRVREARLTWLETRGGVVEITHTTNWKRPFYLELAGVDLVDTEIDGDGQHSAIVDVNDAVPGCAAGLYALEEDASLGKQARVVGVLEGVMLVEFDDDLAYLMTEDAEVPTWQMVWRSGWYFIKRREVSATKSTARSRRSKRTRKRSRNRRSRTPRRR